MASKTIKWKCEDAGFTEWDESQQRTSNRAHIQVAPKYTTKAVESSALEWHTSQFATGEFEMMRWVMI